MVKKKKTKAKVKKTVARRKVAKAPKKPRKSAAKTSAVKPGIPKATESTGAVSLLRAWSPSRYSTR